MSNTIISDTSCLIILTNINEIDLLRKLYGKIITTAEVAEEFGQTLPEWIEIRVASDEFRQRILELQIDKGEASAIALAIELSDSVVILDDYKARKLAESLGIQIIGTIGIIIKAKRQGVIESIKPFLQKIRQTDFRISEEIEKRALEESGE
jgi:predicted nucleic acid-binding protein